MMMSQVAGDVKSKRNYLERVLAINPKNVDASIALTRLTTSPLSPVTRGERDKPIYQSNFDKIPPFTPPDTWGNDQEQFLAPPIASLTLIYPLSKQPKPQKPRRLSIGLTI